MEYVDTNQQRRVFFYGRWQHARHCQASACHLPWCAALKCRLAAAGEAILIDIKDCGSFHEVLPTENNAYIMSDRRRQENARVDRDGGDDGDDENNLAPPRDAA